MHIAVVGCNHGELDKVYDVLAKIEEQQGLKASLLLCCGDFQSVRNMTDLRCMACPIKYQHMHDFHRYYSGEKKAPVLTIFIGGNHEASNFLQELPYGGWVAPNIYYMGYVGVLKYGGVRIAGISGIYKGQDYLKGRFEAPPYDQGTMRSVYHYRNIDVFRIKQLRQPVDIFLSHDWPKGIHNHGNVFKLLRRKPFFRDEIERNEFGSRPLSEVLEKVKPAYWFSAHLHVKFPAVVQHSSSQTPNEDGKSANGQQESSNSSVDVKNTTKFLALDKVLPGRQFLQIFEVPSEVEETNAQYKLQYDPEWLAVLRSTNQLLSMKQQNTFMPGPGGNSRYDFTPSTEEVSEVEGMFDNDLCVPENFCQTAPPYSPDEGPSRANPTINPQTREFCHKLEVTDPLQEIVNSIIKNPLLEGSFGERSHDYSTSSVPMQLTLETSANPDEISIDLDDDAEDLDGQKKAVSQPQQGVSQQIARPKLSLPPPKSSSAADDLSSNSTDKASELQLLESVMGNALDSEGAVSDLFFIDTQGTDNSDSPHSKRRKDLGSFKY